MIHIESLLSAIVFVVLDGIYLNLVQKYFNNQIKIIQGTDIKINLLYTAITYIFLIFGLNYFIIQKRKSVQEAALLGLTIYAVYEFTNASLFSKWSFITVLMDTTWGTILFALTTAIVYKLSKLFKLKSS
jgi:uncharacterized membrane protein